LNNIKIQGSTLIETIISIVIFMMCMFISLSLINSENISGFGKSKIDLHIALLTEVNKTIQEKRYLNETIDYKTYQLKREISKENENGLYLVKIVAFDNHIKEESDFFVNIQK
jgi:hypothetical protein